MSNEFKQILNQLSDNELASIIATITSGYVANEKHTPNKVLEFMEDLYHEIKTPNEQLEQENIDNAKSLCSFCDSVD